MVDSRQQQQGEQTLRSRSATPTTAAGEGLELTQITHRIAALTFPTNGADSVYRASIKEISEKLKRNFPDRYKIFNVSQKRSDLGRANGVGAVVELGWPDDLAPPLDRLCAICKQLENWLCENRQNIAVIHCKGWRSRAAIVVAAYMNYTNICTGGESVDDKFSMQLFSEKFLGAYGQPSHKRYVKYFASLLLGVSRVNASTVYLTKLTFSCLFPETDVVLKIYERMKPVYTSEHIRLRELTRLDLGAALSLRGDVILKCSKWSPTESDSGGGRRLLFQCQFNTCASEFLPNDVAPTQKQARQPKTGRLVFFKEELDRIFADENVDNQAAIELTFFTEGPPPTNAAADNAAGNTVKRVSKTPPTKANDIGGATFARVDSYENFDKSEDDRSVSLPAEGAGFPLYAGIVKNNNTNNNKKPQILKRLKQNDAQQQQKQQQQRRSLNELSQRREAAAATVQDASTRPRSALISAAATADSSGVDSGVGSDSPPRAAATVSTASSQSQSQADSRKPLQGILKHRQLTVVAGGANSDVSASLESEAMPKNPPKVPPKPKSRRSSYAASDDYEPDPYELDPYAESTIGREHSVLPAGLRPRPLPKQYRRVTDSDAAGESEKPQQNSDEDAGAGGANDQDEDEAGEDSERVQKERARRLAKILRIGPDLVGKDRYDPNSKCFSYVPAKSLKEHYRTAPRKQPARRVVATRSESNLSPNGGDKAFEVMPDDLTHRTETPKWENEIDKVAPKATERFSPPPSSHRRSVPPSEMARDYLSEPAPPPRLHQKREQVVLDLRAAANATSSATDALDVIAGKPPPEPERPLRQRREQVARDLYNGSVTPSVTSDIDALAGAPPPEYERPVRQRREQTARDLYDRNQTRSATNELDMLAGAPPPEFRRTAQRQRREPVPRRDLYERNRTPTALDDLDAIYGGDLVESMTSRAPARQKREQEWRDLYNRSTTPGAAAEIDTIANGYASGPQQRFRAHSTLPTPAAARHGQWRQAPRAGALDDFEREERPIILEQARRAVTRTHSPTRQPSRYASTGALNHEMDALLDPNFYLSGGDASRLGSGNGAQSTSRDKSMPATARGAHTTPRYGNGYSSGDNAPHKQISKSVSQKELDDLNDLLDSTAPGVAVTGGAVQRKSRFDAAARTRAGDTDVPTDYGGDYRERNCRSLSAITYNRKPSWNAEASRDTDPSAAEGRDDWLERKLRALQNKRANDSTAQKRRHTERALLEELKNVNTGRNAVRNEADYTLESLGRGDHSNEDQVDRADERHGRITPGYVDELRIANRRAQKEQIRRLGTNEDAPASAATTPRPLSMAQSESGLRWQESPLARASSVTPTPSSVARQPRPPGGAQPKRGATPTGQIVRGKPPTPPPSAAARERSPVRSPMAARRAVAPPTITATRRKSDQNAAAHDVPNSIAALRGSIYAAERDRMALNGGGSGPVHGDESYSQEPYNTTPSGAADSDADSSDGGGDGAETSGGEFSQLKHIVRGTPTKGVAGGARHTTPAAAAVLSNGRGTPAKSILKQRPAPAASTLDDGEPFTYTTPSRYSKEQVAPWRAVPASGADADIENETPAEESTHETPANPLSRSWNRNPNWYLRQTPTSALSERADRAETPAFPTTPHRNQPPMSAALIGDGTSTPLPYHPLLYRSDTPAEENGIATDSRYFRHSNTFPSNAMISRSGSPRSYYDQSRRSSMTSIDGAEVIHNHPVFVKDTSKYWYKPNISREEAINMLKQKPPGTFVVRDSNSFPGAFGLALKVARPPPNAAAQQNGGAPSDTAAELVRHFLIEPSPKGVKLKGCANEPVFGTLAALVYQHSITPLALPCKLLLPEYDPALSANEHQQRLDSNQALLERGAACNVTYLCSIDTESLTGPEALRRAATWGLEDLARGALRAIPVHFKVSAQGITLTDNTRSQFFRRHYAAHLVTYAGIDPDNRVFDNNNCCQLPPCYVLQAPVFGFVARKFVGGYVENACHVFAELDPDQPASAVVRFITNVMMPQAKSQLPTAHLNGRR